MKSFIYLTLSLLILVDPIFSTPNRDSSVENLKILPSPQDVYSECGGVVQIRSTDNPIIDYKHETTSTTLGHCIWTIIPASDHTIQHMIFIIEHQYFEANDGLILYTWDGTDLTPRKLTGSDTGMPIRIATQHAFLYFSSETGGAGVGARMSITGSQEDSIYTNEAFHLNSICPEPFHWPPFPAEKYSSNSIISFIFQAPVYGNSTSLHINYLDTETSHDFLTVYELAPFIVEESILLEGRYTGLHPEGFNRTESTAPRLLLFSSNGQNPSRGFRFDWTV